MSAIGIRINERSWGPGATEFFRRRPLSRAGRQRGAMSESLLLLQPQWSSWCRRFGLRDARRQRPAAVRLRRPLERGARRQLKSLEQADDEVRQRPFAGHVTGRPDRTARRTGLAVHVIRRRRVLPIVHRGGRRLRPRARAPTAPGVTVVGHRVVRHDAVGVPVLTDQPAWSGLHVRVEHLEERFEQHVQTTVAPALYPRSNEIKKKFKLNRLQKKVKPNLH